MTTPTPLYPDPSLLPSIRSQHRLTNTRRKQLLRAASRPHDSPPPPPGLNECCGSSCDPCVKTLWREELGVWRERWGEGAREGGQGAKVEVVVEAEVQEEDEDPALRVEGTTTSDEGASKTMPGAWIEW